MGGRLLEICCDSVQSALAAADGGADRIELCSDLAVDGLTPSREVLENAGDLPVFALVRSRGGGFVYADEELRLMVEQISALRTAGADGIVSGALTPDEANVTVKA